MEKRGITHGKTNQNYNPLPYIELEEIEDEIKQLENMKAKIWNEWQQSISDLRVKEKNEQLHPDLESTGSTTRSSSNGMPLLPRK